MELYTGIDIIEVERIKDNIEGFGESFLYRIYTKKEIEYCERKGVNKYQSYAARFAAKEAVLKAISQLLGSKYDIKWNDIEVLNDESGRPYVNILINLEKIIKIDISLSHIKDIAVASVIVNI